MAKKETPETASEAVKRIIQEVQHYFDDQDADYFMEQALTQLNKAAEMQPDNAEIYYWMGYCYACGLNKQEEGMPYFEKAIALRPDYLDAHLELANAQRDVNDQYAIFERIIKDYPSCLQAWNNVIFRLKYLKQPAQAIEKAKEMLALNADNPDAYIMMANVYMAAYIFEKGDDASAVPFFDKAIELAPNNPNYYYQRYFVLFRLGRYEQALQDLLMQEKLKTKTIIVYYFIDTYTALKNYKKALAICNEWMLSQTGDEFPYRKRADIYLAMGEYDLALNDLERANRKTKGYQKSLSAFFLAEKAKIWLLKGDKEQALQCIDEAIKKADNNTSKFSFSLEKIKMQATKDKQATAEAIAKLENKFAEELKYEYYQLLLARAKETLGIGF